VHTFLIPFQDYSKSNWSFKTAIARFDIPAYNGAGDYVVWYNWSGYRDCIDVNVRGDGNPVVNRYGTIDKTKQPNIVKIDHCQFRAIPQATTQCRKLPQGGNGDITQCVNDCIAAGSDNCKAIQVTPYKNPPNTLPQTVNIPFVYQTFNAAAFNSNPPIFQRTSRAEGEMHADGSTIRDRRDIGDRMSGELPARLPPAESADVRSSSSLALEACCPASMHLAFL
jgi:hypothetical protein